MSSYFGYGAAKDTVYRVSLRPNPSCADSWCRKRQQERRAQLVARGLSEDAAWDAEAQLTAAVERERLAREAASLPLHDDNEFCIELVSASDGTAGENKIEEIIPLIPKAVTSVGESEIAAATDGGHSLDELVKQLKSL